MYGTIFVEGRCGAEYLHPLTWYFTPSSHAKFGADTRPLPPDGIPSPGISHLPGMLNVARRPDHFHPRHLPPPVFHTVPVFHVRRARALPLGRAKRILRPFLSLSLPLPPSPDPPSPPV
eukprot:scaffold26192_cov75-Isochrysis_galbana.AAC.2